MVKSKLLFMLALSLLINVSNENTMNDFGVSSSTEGTKKDTLEDIVLQTERKKLKKYFLEDIILTDTERGIDTEDNYVFNLMLRDSLSHEYLSFEEKERIEHLNVRKFATQFLLSPLVYEKINYHQNTSLYLEETDDLDWELLYNLLKENGKKKIEYEKELWKDELKYYEKYSNFEVLSDEDLKEWISQLQDFLEIVKKDYPEFNLKRLACVLEDYCVFNTPRDSFDEFTYAATGNEYMEYPLLDGHHPDFEKFEQINYHEFWHLIGLSCEDEKSELGTLESTGISYDIELIYDENFIHKYKFEYADWNIYFPFRYVYLEEANAELYSSRILNVEPISYEFWRFLVENIEFSLSLQPYYQKDSFKRYSINHEFLKILSEFPVLDGPNEIERECFFNQLEMLECYNIVLDSRKIYDFTRDTCNMEEKEKIDSNIIILEDFADLQLTRNFIWSLINLKNTKETITLEDYCFLMNLFLKRIDANRKNVAISNEIDDIDTTIYIARQKELLSIFDIYLKKVYGEQVSFKISDVENYVLSDAFSEEEKEYFYQIYYNLEWMNEERKEISIKDGEILKLEMKPYYRLED